MNDRVPLLADQEKGGLKHQPIFLSFDKLSVHAQNKQILYSVSGTVIFLLNY